jgi:signal transduction histidine kinase
MSLELLRSVPLFAGLSTEDLQAVYRIAERLRLEPGSVLFSEGSAGDTAYVLLEGELEIVKSSGGRPVLLSVRMKPGDLVGEMALLEQSPRMATVRARTASTLLAIPQAQFEALLSSSPSAARALFRTVLARWKETESMLHQSEKMAQLGTLTAGIAHELNNPAAAVRRSAVQLREAIQEWETVHAATAGPVPEDLRQRAVLKAEKPEVLDSLERSDREAEIAKWLAGHALGDAEALAPLLVSLGYTDGGLAELAARFPARELAAVLRRLETLHALHTLLREIVEGTGRLSDIVKALRSYSFLDQAPLQNVDVHEGLENTLLLLGHKLKGNIEIRREYAKDLPRIEAYGSELNQVWTNIIDNAADALGGAGCIRIRTRREGEWVVVEIEDNGPGVPVDVRARVFDAFFTTKQPGQGTGLGLNISYNIVVGRHRGDITLVSEPGKTCFQVMLPILQPRLTAQPR